MVERSCPAADDTELLPDNEVTRVEEALQQAEEDGIQLEPFNLAQVRTWRLKGDSGHPELCTPRSRPRGHICMGEAHVQTPFLSGTWGTGEGISSVLRFRAAP